MCNRRRTRGKSMPTSGVLLLAVYLSTGAALVTRCCQYNQTIQHYHHLHLYLYKALFVCIKDQSLRMCVCTRAIYYKQNRLRHVTRYRWSGWKPARWVCTDTDYRYKLIFITFPYVINSSFDNVSASVTR